MDISCHQNLHRHILFNFLKISRLFQKLQKNDSPAPRYPRSTPVHPRLHRWQTPPFFSMYILYPQRKDYPPPIPIDARCVHHRSPIFSPPFSPQIKKRNQGLLCKIRIDNLSSKILIPQVPEPPDSRSSHWHSEYPRTPFPG